jgi:F like protein
MRKLIAALEKQLGIAWRDVVEWLRETNSIALIEERLASGLIDDVIAEVPAAGAKLASEITEAYVTAGQRTAAWLDRKVGDALVRFDITNHRAVARAEANQLELVSGLMREQRTIAQNVISDGVRRSANPREIARDLRDSIGLTETQEKHVRSFRRALESGDYSNALRRELRDKRSDRLLQRLRREKTALTPAQVDKLVEGYRQRYIAFRAETIARTESLRATHQGNEDLFAQAIERGDIEAADLVREWHAGSGPRTRDSHRTMNGQRRAFGEAFTSGKGVSLRYPGDPSAPASESANCRCSVSTTYAATE